MGIPLRRGRVFDRSDQPETPSVTVINQVMARQMFGEDDPTGRRFQSSDGTTPTDTTTMALRVATVLVAALLASWIPPAWRATQLDPLETLRNE